MGEENSRLILFKKCWNFRDGRYGEKDYWFNPAVNIKGIEECKISNGKIEIDCVKIFYPSPDGFIILIGTIEEFFKKCRDINISICLIQDLYKEGFTIRQFMEQTGKLNDVNLM